MKSHKGSVSVLERAVAFLKIAWGAAKGCVTVLDAGGACLLEVIPDTSIPKQCRRAVSRHCAISGCLLLASLHCCITMVSKQYSWLSRNI